jgi:hypothetical protein
LRAVTRSLVAIAVAATAVYTGSVEAAIIGGQHSTQSPSALTVLYVNGIQNDEQDTALSSEALYRALLRYGLPRDTYNFRYFYNPTEELNGDLAEVRRQAGISSGVRASSNSDAEYYASLGAFYNSEAAVSSSLGDVEQRVVGVADQLRAEIEKIIEAGSRVVIVAHSQGNLYAEAAYAMIAKGNPAHLAKIRVINVADASSSTPSNRLITHTSDRVIEGLRTETGNLLHFTVPSSNVTACQPGLTIFLTPKCGFFVDWASIDPDPVLGIAAPAHNFRLVYLNDSLTSQADDRKLPEIIYNYVSDSLTELTPAPPPPVPFDAFNNLGNGQFSCGVSGSGSSARLDCSGEQIGFWPGLGPFPAQPQSKAAVPFDVPATSDASLTSISVPVYLSAGANVLAASVYPDKNGAPDLSAPLDGSSILGGMKLTNAFFTDPSFPIVTFHFSPDSVILGAGKRYWVEVSSPNPTTRAIWTFPSSPTIGSVATSSNGSAYNVFTPAEQPAIRIVITPRSTPQLF